METVQLVYDECAAAILENSAIYIPVSAASVPVNSATSVPVNSTIYILVSAASVPVNSATSIYQSVQHLYWRTVPSVLLISLYCPSNQSSR